MILDNSRRFLNDTCNSRIEFNMNVIEIVDIIESIIEFNALS